MKALAPKKRERKPVRSGAAVANNAKLIEALREAARIVGDPRGIAWVEALAKADQQERQK